MTDNGVSGNVDPMDNWQPLREAMRAAEVGAVADVGGFDAVKQPDGNWLVEGDDEFDRAESVRTTDEVLNWMCCAHGAHYPHSPAPFSPLCPEERPQP